MIARNGIEMFSMLVFVLIMGTLRGLYIVTYHLKYASSTQLNDFQLSTEILNWMKARETTFFPRRRLFIGQLCVSAYTSLVYRVMQF
jgi:hypothetical protein